MPLLHLLMPAYMLGELRLVAQTLAQRHRSWHCCTQLLVPNFLSSDVISCRMVEIEASCVLINDISLANFSRYFIIISLKKPYS